MHRNGARTRPLGGKNGNPPDEDSTKEGSDAKLHWVPTNNPDEKEPDGATARRIAHLITEHKDKPFFIGCGFRASASWTTECFLATSSLKNSTLPAYVMMVKPLATAALKPPEWSK